MCREKLGYVTFIVNFKPIFIRLTVLTPGSLFLLHLSKTDCYGVMGVNCHIAVLNGLFFAYV